MTLEAKIDKTNELLQAILTAVSSAGAITVSAAAAAAASAPAADKPAATTKPKAEAKPAAAPAAEPAKAPAPAPAAEAQKTEATAAPSFDEVVRTIMEINKSKAPGHGREGVLRVLNEFGFDGSEGKRVPNLEALGKNAEILAFSKSLLEVKPAADDLGI